MAKWILAENMYKMYMTLLLLTFSMCGRLLSAHCITIIGQIIKSVCLCVNESVAQTSWTLYRSQFYTDLHQTCHQGRVLEDVVARCFWWKSGISMSIKPEMELLLPLFLWKNSFNVKYLENSKRYDDGLKGGRIGSQSWTFSWHYELWPQMTLNPPCSRSWKFDFKCFENGDRCDNGVNGSWIGNYPFTIDWHHIVWPLLTLDCHISWFHF